jgi:hypothetical protein
VPGWVLAPAHKTDGLMPCSDKGRKHSNNSSNSSQGNCKCVMIDIDMHCDTKVHLGLRIVVLEFGSCGIDNGR